jgi:serine/threonine-protein kinase RsbT
LAKPVEPDSLKTEPLEVRASPDVDAARRSVQALAAAIGMDDSNQDMLGTATSELARNMLDHGGGGHVLIEVVHSERGEGVRVTFDDHGPGIADIAQAMEDGYSTGTGMGLGLPGAKRLVDDFEIASRDGHGTRVIIKRWVGP